MTFGEHQFKFLLVPTLLLALPVPLLAGLGVLWSHLLTLADAPFSTPIKLLTGEPLPPADPMALSARRSPLCGTTHPQHSGVRPRTSRTS